MAIKEKSGGFMEKTAAFIVDKRNLFFLIYIRMDACLEVWSINLPEGSQQLRFQLPKGCNPDKVLLRL